jgi:hypothetical protein
VLEPHEFQKAILKLIENKEERNRVASNAFASANATSWENIAIKYALLYAELTDRTEDLRFKSPPIKLDHIKKLTTDFGILQYCQDREVLKLADVYLSFVEGMQRNDGWFDNYKDFNQELTNQNLEVNLEDANGRALWSLGYLIANKNALPLGLVLRAEKCWNKALEKINDINSPRAIAYAIKGLYHYYSVCKEEKIKKQIARFSETLLHHYKISSEDKWFWYEDYMTYANNVLPEAMMYSYLVTKNNRFKKIAEISFDFLLTQYFMKGQIKVITNRGWFKKKNERDFYGEQPMEVVTTIIALDLFYEVTGKTKYKNQLELAFSWFMGNNHLKQIMYNPVNGASYDGLEDTHININQGAESTLCFFKAQIIMDKYSKKPATYSSESLDQIVH